MALSLTDGLRRQHLLKVVSARLVDGSLVHFLMLLRTNVFGDLLFSHGFHPFKLFLEKLDVEGAVFRAELVFEDVRVVVGEGVSLGFSLRDLPEVPFSFLLDGLELRAGENG